MVASTGETPDLSRNPEVPALTKNSANGALAGAQPSIAEAQQSIAEAQQSMAGAQPSHVPLDNPANPSRAEPFPLQSDISSPTLRSRHLPLESQVAEAAEQPVSPSHMHGLTGEIHSLPTASDCEAMNISRVANRSEGTAAPDTDTAQVIVHDAILGRNSRIYHEAQDVLGSYDLKEQIEIHDDTRAKRVIEDVHATLTDRPSLKRALEQLTQKNEEFRAEIIYDIVNGLRARDIARAKAEGEKRFFSEGFGPFADACDLLEALAGTQGEMLFVRHVGPAFDHFAQWIEDSLSSPALAARLRGILSRDAYVDALVEALDSAPVFQTDIDQKPTTPDA
jgi:hypothetical protein